MSAAPIRGGTMLGRAVLPAVAMVFLAGLARPQEPVREALPDLLRRLADRSAEEPCRLFLEEARKDAAKPLLHRPASLQALLDSGWRLKYRVRPPHISALPDREWEIFMLSQGDNAAGNVLKIRLPRMAAAFAMTEESALLERVLEQLEELAAWSPLERRGWSLNNSKPRFTGDDGAWLGTGWLVRAIADSLDLLPPDQVPPKLRAALESRLEAEIGAMEEDWDRKRPWYFRSEAAHSNQWILPNEALVRACLAVGAEQHAAAYERGVANLLRSMEVQGAEGEFVEGLRYSGISLESLYSIARATADRGDGRLLAHPFLRKYPVWLAHHYQPGGFSINAFDAPSSSRGSLTRDQGLLATAAVATGSPVALWALRTRAGFAKTLDGILAAAMEAAPATPPPLWAAYAQATRLNWRSSWDDETATGFWLRGGHATDFHDHMDRGHVNFIVGQRPVLIEAGTLNYAAPEFRTHMRSVAGHNVLQIGVEPPEQLTLDVLKRAGQRLDRDHRPAPIAVERMDGKGGAASVDMSACYGVPVRWQRRVEWDGKTVTVDDEVEFPEPRLAQFRWHLGVLAEVPALVEPGRILAGDVRLAFTTDPEVEALVEPMPDATLTPGRIASHVCVVLRPRTPVLRWKLQTRAGLAD